MILSCLGILGHGFFPLGIKPSMPHFWTCTEEVYDSYTGLVQFAILDWRFFGNHSSDFYRIMGDLRTN